MDIPPRPGSGLARTRATAAAAGPGHTAAGSTDPAAPAAGSTPPDVEPTGILGLDFVNTVGDGADLLEREESFRVWLGVVAPDLPALLPSDLPSRRVVLAEARALRSALRCFFRAVTGQTEADAATVFALDRVLRSGRVRHGLSVVDGRPALNARYEPNGPLAALSALARSAVETALSVDPGRLRECAAPDCSRWFVDTSKGGRRRWCSMARCGNRAKAARYRARHAQTG